MGLIIKEYDWTFQEKLQAAYAVMQIRVAADEWELRQQVKQAGGIWNPQLRVWELRHDQVIALGREDRIFNRKVGKYASSLASRNGYHVGRCTYFAGWEKGGCWYI